MNGSFFHCSFVWQAHCDASFEAMYSFIILSLHDFRLVVALFVQRTEMSDESSTSVGSHLSIVQASLISQLTPLLSSSSISSSDVADFRLQDCLTVRLASSKKDEKESKSTKENAESRRSLWQVTAHAKDNGKQSTYRSQQCFRMAVVLHPVALHHPRSDDNNFKTQSGIDINDFQRSRVSHIRRNVRVNKFISVHSKCITLHFLSFSRQFPPSYAERGPQITINVKI